jgi:uncharacterized protein (DUF58 family)
MLNFGGRQQDTPLEDPTALAKFGRLEVVAKLVVEGYMMGQHKSPFKGASVEFVEHRNYYPGDEIRHIDWRAYGKTGKYYVKEFEDETNLRCQLFVDASGSMGYAGRTLSKLDYCRYLAASLGHLLLRQRDATGLIAFDTKVRERIEPSTNPKNFQRLVKTLEALEPGRETSLAKVIEDVLPTLKRRGLIVLFSDCFDRIDPLMTALNALRHSRHEVIVFHVVAPEEETFPFAKPTMFRSLEQRGQRMLVDPHRLRKHYIEQYEAFCTDLAKRCRGIGIDYFRLVTSEPYHIALGRYLDSRVRSTKKG